MKREDQKRYEQINTLLRYAILDMTTVAGSGHPTSSLSAVELMSTLMFSGVFRYDVINTKNICNDRLIFSKGHASPLYYALWASAGAIDFGELQSFRKFDSNLEGHPTKRFPFTEAATGSLGQGLSVGVGLALAQKKLDQTDARTYVLLGDSEMAEGQVWEAMQVAAHYKLDNLIAIADINRLGQRGETMLGHEVEVYAERARSFGWRAVVVDGHDIEGIYRVYDDVIGENKKPLMIIAKTFKGKGVSFLEDKYNWHGKTLSKEEFIDAVEQLGYVDFDVRGEIAAPQDCDNKKLRQENDVRISEVDLSEKHATRDGYGHALMQLMQDDEKVVVLDAETSNSTRAESVKDFFPERFFEMFIAEQNMVSVAVGLSQAGYKPFVSSFAAFLTRAHDQIRMAALSESNMTIVGSHCGVSIGADGASQMGLDDISMMRSMFDSTILYPSDFVSTQKLLQIAKNNTGITYVRTTREKTVSIYNDNEKFSIGGLSISFDDPGAYVVVIAAGITVHEAIKAAKALRNVHVPIRVIDLYSVKPINEELLSDAVSNAQHVIVVEDHYSEGGIGDAVRGALINSYKGAIHQLAVQKMPRSGTSEELLAYEKIDFNAIIEKVQTLI